MRIESTFNKYEPLYWPEVVAHEPLSLKNEIEKAPRPLSQDSIETSSDTVTTRSLLPRLDPPTSKIDQAQESIEHIVHLMHMSLIENQEKNIMTNKRYFLIEQMWGKHHESEKTQQYKTVQEATLHMQGAQKVEKAVSTVGFTIAGIATIITGCTPLAVGALICGALFTLDSLLDDVMKKQVASWIAPQDREAQKIWLSRIQMFTSVASLGLSFGLTGPRAVSVALKVANSAVIGFKGAIEYKLSHLEAALVECESACKRSESHQSRFITDLEHTTQSIYDLYSNLRAIEEQKHAAARTILRRA